MKFKRYDGAYLFLHCDVEKKSDGGRNWEKKLENVGIGWKMEKLARKWGSWLEMGLGWKNGAKLACFGWKKWFLVFLEHLHGMYETDRWRGMSRL